MEIYCGQLGMATTFSYCISVNEGLPCRNVIGCWKGRGDIISYLKTQFKEEELRSIFGGLPKSKIERIIEAMRESKERSF
jgi:hypothetical protein